jgi:TRAP-type C4-dicarboxylate transport system permease small subunit
MDEVWKKGPLPLRLMEYGGILTIFIMMLHVVANALGRAFWNSPLENTLEMTEFWYMPVLGLLGIVVAEARKQHIIVDIVYVYFPRIAQRCIYVVICVVTAVLMAAFAWYGLEAAQYSHEIRRTGGVTGLEIWPVYYLVPVSFLALVIQNLWATRKPDPLLEQHAAEQEIVAAEVRADDVNVKDKR